MLASLVRIHIHYRSVKLLCLVLHFALQLGSLPVCLFALIKQLENHINLQVTLRQLHSRFCAHCWRWRYEQVSILRFMKTAFGVLLHTTLAELAGIV